MNLPEHPMSEPLVELTSEELDKRYSDLMYRFNIARRMKMAQHIMHQIDLLLAAVDAERARRQRLDDRPDGVILDTDPIGMQETRKLDGV